MERSEKVAFPPVSDCDRVPPSVPPPGFAPIATDTVPCAFVRVLPQPSSAVATTGGVTVAPDTTCCGGEVVKASFATVREGFAPLSVKSLPVPLKSFDCLTSFDHE